VSEFNDRVIADVPAAGHDASPAHLPPPAVRDVADLAADPGGIPFDTIVDLWADATQSRCGSPTRRSGCSLYSPKASASRTGWRHALADLDAAAGSTPAGRPPWRSVRSLLRHARSSVRVR
jgi:hypothetical protein